MNSHTKLSISVFSLVFGLFIAFTSFISLTSASPCSGNTDECFPPVQGNCYANVSRTDIGQEVTWRATVSGGNDFYSFYWSGTDGLRSTEPGVYKTYSSAGTKTATVEITSYGNTITRTCSVIIEDDEEEQQDNLSILCRANPSSVDIDEEVTWTASASGGSGSYSYSWSGTDNLRGSSRIVNKSYDTDGTKRGTVRVTSGGRSQTATCTTRVNEDENNNNDLEAYCRANPSSGRVGDRITWTVYPSGGSSSYRYDWEGDDNLRGTSKSVSKTYQSTGRKNAEVEVRSGSDRVTVRCNVNISGDTVVKDGIYLSSVPATGISPSMKTGLFATGVVLWSAFLGYLYVSRRNEKKREQEILNSLK